MMKGGGLIARCYGSKVITLRIVVSLENYGNNNAYEHFVELLQI